MPDFSRKNKNGKCECCGFEGITIREYPIVQGELCFDVEKPSSRWICSVCADTFLGNLHVSPLCNHDIRMLARAVGHCTNLILKAIEDFKESMK